MEAARSAYPRSRAVPARNSSGSCFARREPKTPSDSCATKRNGSCGEFNGSSRSRNGVVAFRDTSAHGRRTIKVARALVWKVERVPSST
jgi:hypothetical protein